MSTSLVAPSAALPIRVDDVLLEAVHANDDQLVVRLVVFDAGDVIDVKEQELSWTALAVTDAAELSERVRQRLARIEPSAVMPWDLLRKPNPYQPVGPFAEPDPRLWYQAVVIAIHEQAREDGFDARFERIEDWPVEAATAYFLWLAEAMLGGNGLLWFLAQAPVEEVMGVLAALERAHCRGLETRYREALGVVRSAGGAEFLQTVDEDWLDEHSVALAPGSPRPDIDHWNEGGTYWLLRHELQPAIIAYVREHRQALVTG